MPTWLLAALPSIQSAVSVGEGLFKLFEAGTAEIKSSDNPAQKAEAVLTDVASAASEVGQAVVANTPHEAPAAS